LIINNLPYEIALSEKKVEVRVQMRDVPGLLYPQISRNEIVIRVQPDEAIYLKMMNKKPGFELESTITELNLDYKMRYPDAYIPEAYEALLVDVLKEDHSNFVRNDELEFAWRIFTPLLHQIESTKVAPVVYPFGSRGPAGIDNYTSKYGFKYAKGYTWTPPKTIDKVPSRTFLFGKKSSDNLPKFYF
jgi:glucose-6-phosphate 1-dehydrogenase